jgi:hypothetical protein
MDQIKYWKTKKRSSHNVDERILELARVIARSVARRDFEKQLKEEKPRT